ncbi:radical SAM protein [Anaerovorax odorimutans]|uniref:Radical SAM protein n=1 Tax=Anaerovorax odorimutans TaxID=109327 RepID=A0ABT1RR07_9FIRM|nr:radical SAM protein [Anaerovorax odorimutans]MCQ4637635.1 radical SAM protein [Anaerovorax odorimutans]
MKTHAIIPIFIPHQGCPNDCVFCNQKKITARQPDMGEGEIKNTIETWLTTLTDRPGIETVEIAFFGGSFTGIPLEKQSQYLKIAHSYKKNGLVDKIHLSTRPDYIDERILDNLKAYETDVIELGVQSFDDDVLKASGRGHNSEVVYKASELIQEYEFELGIQLMIGLPEDSMEKCLYSARETVKIGPSLARLYPTIVIEDTELMELYRSGRYTPLSTEQAVEITKEMYKILTGAGINIIRVGLKSSDLIKEHGEIEGHTFHPAFRQLVEGAIAREKMEWLLQENVTAVENEEYKEAPCYQPFSCKEVTFFSSEKWFSNMIGHKGRNKAFFAKQFPDLTVHYKTCNLKDGSIAIAVAGCPHLVVE